MPSQFPSNNVSGDLKVTGKITAGSGAVDIISSAGKIPALSSTYLADLDGSNLTGVGGGPTVLTKTGDFTVSNANAETLLLCNTSSGNITITLYASSGQSGNRVIVKKIHASNSLIVDGNSSETIDAATTKTITAMNTSVSMVCDGSNWFIY
jgi:hypothetical protein